MSVHSEYYLCKPVWMALALFPDYSDVKQKQELKVVLLRQSLSDQASTLFT